MQMLIVVANFISKFGRQTSHVLYEHDKEQKVSVGLRYGTGGEGERRKSQRTMKSLIISIRCLYSTSCLFKLKIRPHMLVMP